jgi:hypothetical protein
MLITLSFINGISKLSVGLRPLDYWYRGSNPAGGLDVFVLCLLCVV